MGYAIILKIKKEPKCWTIPGYQGVQGRVSKKNEIFKNLCDYFQFL